MSRRGILGGSLLSIGMSLGGCGASFSADQPLGPMSAAIEPPKAQHLLLLEESGPPNIVELSLASGETKTFSELPDLSFAYELSWDKQHSQLILAYTPPPEEGELAFDRSAIFASTEDGAWQHLACDSDPGVWCFYPTASNDRVWFVQSGEGLPDGYEFVLSQANLTSGEVEEVAQWATEPAVSPDGEHVVWVAADPETGARSLRLADRQGHVIRTLIEAQGEEDLGQPTFSSDGSDIYFVRIGVPSTSLIDTLTSLLLPTAYAHNSHDLPGDWWSINIVDGHAEQLTDLDTIHYDGRADSGGEWLFIATREGVYQVATGTGDAQLILPNRSIRALDIK